MRWTELEAFELEESDELPAAFVDVFLAWPKLRELEANFAQPLRADDAETLLLRCPLLRRCKLTAPCREDGKHREPSSPPAAVREINHLNFLELVGCTVDDAFFAKFSFPRLEELVLYHASVRVLRFEDALACMPALKNLTIGAGAEVQLTRAASCAPLALQNLSIFSADCRSSDWWFLLRSAPRLIELEIGDSTRVTPTDMRSIAAQNLRSIRNLTLQPESSAAVTANGITALIELCPTLRVLQFSSRAVTDAIVEQLLETYRGRRRAASFELRDSTCRREDGRHPLLLFDASGARKPEPKQNAEA